MKLRLTLLAVLVSLLYPAALWAGGRLEIRAVDAETNKPLAVRMYLKNAQGKPVKPAKLKDAVIDGDSLVFYDKIKLDLPTGGYEFQMERGLEYKVMNGTFEIQNFADDTKTVPLTRFCDMTAGRLVQRRFGRPAPGKRFEAFDAGRRRARGAAGDMDQH